MTLRNEEHLEEKKKKIKGGKHRKYGLNLLLAPEQMPRMEKNALFQNQ